MNHNFDDLHRQAGSRSVIEPDGTTQPHYCSSGSKRFDFNRHGDTTVHKPFDDFDIVGEEDYKAGVKAVGL